MVPGAGLTPPPTSTECVLSARPRGRLLTMGNDQSVAQKPGSKEFLLNPAVSLCSFDR